MIMEASTAVTKDPVCGMTVDPGTALHAERDGHTSYFCSDHCKTKWLAMPADARPKDEPKDCCG